MNRMMKVLLTGSMICGGVYLYNKYNPKYMKEMKKTFKKMKNIVNNMYLDMM